MGYQFELAQWRVELIKINIADREAMEKLFAEHKFPSVIHLAAQAGVRCSLKNPHACIQSNVVGFMNILEGRGHNKVEHLVYVSNSSVCGLYSKSAVQRTRQHRPPGEPLRRGEEIERVDGAYVQPFVRVADDGTEILHCLRPLGAAGHGADDLRQSHHGGHAD